jgi:hypothetical protein
MLDDSLKKTEVNRAKTLLIPIVVASIIVALSIGFFLLISSGQKQESEMLEGAIREGSDEFATLTRKIIAETDYDNTLESPIGLGTVMMSVAGKLRNRSDKVIIGLEVKVAVLDIKGVAMQEKKFIVVPTERDRLAPGEEMSTVVRMDGFSQNDGRAGVKWKVTAIKIAE